MSLFNSFDRAKHFLELASPLVTAAGVKSAATRRAEALTNIAGAAMTAAQLAAVAGVTPGTVAAGKAMVVDSNLDISGVRHFTITGNFVTGATTLSAAELAVLDGVTAGTVAASKAVVVDANKDVLSFRDVRARRVLYSQGASSTDTTAGNITITAAMILSGRLVRDPNGAARTDTFDTAANIVAALPNAAVGDELEFDVINNADAAEAITLAVPASGSFIAANWNKQVAQNGRVRVTIRLTNVTGGAEAYTVN